MARRFPRPDAPFDSVAGTRIESLQPGVERIPRGMLTARSRQPWRGYEGPLLSRVRPDNCQAFIPPSRFQMFV